MLSIGKDSDFFNEFASVFDTIYDNQRNPFMRWVDRQFRSDMFIRFTRTFEVLSPMTGKTILDIGCGSGPYVIESFRRGAARVTAVDPAFNMLQIVKKRLEGMPFSDSCLLIQGYFPEVQLPPHDYVIIMGVLDYIANPYAFLKAARQMTKEICIASFPSKHWLRTGIRKARYAFRNCPVYFYDMAMIRQLSNEAGFTDVTIYKIPGAGMDYHVTLR